MIYEISGCCPIDKKITKVVMRERLIERLGALEAKVTVSEEDGTLTFSPRGKMRGQHPLKNITSGRLQVLADADDHPYVTEIAFQLSLAQIRFGLLVATGVIWAYSLLRGYSPVIPLAFTLLAWIFGYLTIILTLRSRFDTFLQNLE